MVNGDGSRWKGPLLQGGTIALWLIVSGLAIWEILVVRAMMVRVTTRMLVALAGLSEIMATVWAYRVGAVAALLMAGLALLIVLGGLDSRGYRIGKFPAWKVLLWVLGAEFVILGLAFLF